MFQEKFVSTRKTLDMMCGPVLYKAVRAVRCETYLMMTIRKHNEQTMMWQPSAAMYSLVCSLGGRFGQISEDRLNNSRH